MSLISTHVIPFNTDRAWFSECSSDFTYKKKQMNVNTVTKCSLMLRLQTSCTINNSPILAMKKIFRLLPCWVFFVLVCFGFVFVFLGHKIN